MRITQKTIDLVKRFEGKELSAYIDPVGVLTIGYGYTNRAGFGPGVRTGDTWTEIQAEEMLREGLELFGNEIKPLFSRVPNDNQFGAFVSLAYNIGTTAFAKSTALRRFNAGDTAGAADAMTWFNKAGGKVLRGLVRRREAERQMFLDEPDHVGASVVPQQPRTPFGLKTNKAALGVMLAFIAQASEMVNDTVATVSETLGIPSEAAIALIGCCLAVWIFWERAIKFINGDR